MPYCGIFLIGENTYEEFAAGNGAASGILPHTFVGYFHKPVSMRPPHCLQYSCSCVLLLLATAMLAGCRSERMAFQFQPARRAMIHDGTVNLPIQDSALALPPGPTIIKPGQTNSGKRPQASAVLPTLARAHPRWKSPLIGHLAGTARPFLQRPLFKAVRLKNAVLRQQSALPAVSTAARASRASLNSGHLLQGLGILLSIGGILLGVQLGGWLGLGVGFLLLLLGCFIWLLGILKNSNLP
jgi:hypothetical protein